MAKTYPIQQSFSAGEISPKMIARTDQEGYNHSTQLMLNMIPSIQGPASDRPGFEFIDKADDPTEQYCRMIPFQISFDEAYVVIITISTVYIADRDGFQLDTNEFVNSDFSAGGTGWTQVESGGANVTFPAGTCVLNPSNSQPAAINQAVDATGTEANQYWVGFSGLNDAPCRIMVGSAVGGSDIVDQLIVGEDGGLFFTPGVSNFFVQYQADPGGVTKILDTVAVVDTVTGQIFVRFTSPWTTPTIIEELQFDTVPGQGLMYLVQRDVPPQFLDYVDERQWAFGPLVFIAPMPWGASNPGSIAFYKGRLYLGGTRADKVGIWASKPADYLNFVLPTGTPVDSDAMYLPIGTDGEILWMLSTKALTVGMDTGEHIILAEGGGIPTPANVDTEQQSAYGSSRVQAKRVGEQIAYVTSDRRRLYISTYSRDDLGWISEDVSYSAEHITAGLLREIELSTDLFNVLWLPTLEGKLVGVTYDPRRKIIGWHQHQTDGFIVTTTVLKARGLSELWIGVLRDHNGALELHFEKADTEFKLDSFLEFTVATPQTTFTGYEHLDGRTVQVLADGAVHPDVVVGANGNVGEITLQLAATHIAAGLGYSARMITLPIDMLTQDESKASYEKSWIRIYLRLLNSAVPLVNGTRLPTRNEATPMGEREPYRTEDVDMANLGWDLYGAIDIEQDLPLHLTVMGVFGELDMDNI